MNISLVLCNFPKLDADKIAKIMVEKRIAICVYTLPPMESYYPWMEQAHMENQVTLLITTYENFKDDVYDVIADSNPVDLPVIVSLPIENTYAPYLKK